MTLTAPPLAVHVLARLTSGLPVNGEAAGLAGPWRRLADRLAGCELECRLKLLADCLLMLDEPADVLSAIRAADPEAPPPESTGPRRPACLSDLRRVLSTTSWVWEGWIPQSRLTGVGAFEGVGKSRFGLDLARRIWNALEWPDGQGSSFPAGTPTLWLPCDGNQDDLLEAAESMGLPDHAVYFNTLPENPYGGTDLDDVETLAALEEFVTSSRPGIVFIDTLSNATNRDLCRQNEVRTVMAPLRELAQRLQIPIVLFLHLSKDGQALGRRIKGTCRTIVHVDCPDPERSPRLKLWVEKSYAKKPPPLGVTMRDDGNVYDSNPPRAADKSLGGRPSGAREKAEVFIVEALGRQNDQVGNELCEKWEGAKATFWRAVDVLKEAGRIATDGGKGTGRPTVLHLVQGDKPIGINDAF